MQLSQVTITHTETADGETTTRSATLEFTYSASGAPQTVICGENTYLCVTNLQGDVVAILDSAGTPVVEYTYDAWGSLLNTNSSVEGHVVEYNPLRYRGYVYDIETELYYLQSRYYDPELGRFLNADALIATGQGLLGNNMFAYCRNNPVKRVDVSGTNDLCYTDGDDDNIFNDVGHGIGGSGTSNSYSSYANAYNPIDDGYSYGVDFSINMHANAYTGSIYQTGYSVVETYSQPSACFVAGTLVQSEDGAVAIENISVGDKVWAWDEATGDVALKEVVETYVNQSDELIHVFVNGEEIITTPTHPFYSPVKGWTAAAKLRAGDILVLVNGEYVVVEKAQHEILEAPIAVYNFEVEDYHTYYVGKHSILVHNVCGAQKALPKNGIKVNSSDALDLAEDFLGKGYSEMSPGRFVSSDGLRQVRMTASDLTSVNNHAGAPHLNFEKLVPNPLKPGKFQIIENSHVYIFD